MNNEQLKSVYSEFFRVPKLRGALAEKCSAPLLLSVKPSWEKSNIRLLVVGQETTGWGFKQGPLYNWQYPPIFSYQDFLACDRGVEALMYGYREFNFAARQPENYSSPFWRAFRELGTSLGAESLWSNLFLCSVEQGSVIHNCSQYELQELLQSQKGLLQKEIQVLKPNAIVFFTGPNYDFALKAEFEQAVFEPIDDDRAGKFDRVLHERLPDKCFRTYHPAYLHRSPDRWKWLGELVHLVRPVP